VPKLLPYRAIQADTEEVIERSDFNWDEVKANLDIYPWVVWEITVRDPGEVLRHADVAEVTRAAATEAAKLYGCVYEYCVDDDNMPDGTKYYEWYVGVKQSEHRQLVGRKGTPIRVAKGIHKRQFVDSRPQPIPDVRPERDRQRLHGKRNRVGHNGYQKLLRLRPPRGDPECTASVVGQECRPHQV
jgi:hypothetical protein